MEGENSYQGMSDSDEDMSTGTKTTVYPDNSKYDGEWKDTKRSGTGIMTWPNGDTYEGEWLDNMLHGKGVMTYADGRLYVGQWERGAKHGNGEMKYADGREYRGEWQYGERHGSGKMTYASGDVYEGQWKNHMKCGRGVYRYHNGDVYEGHFKRDKKHGGGTYIYSSGRVFTGNWENDKQNGSGKYEFPNGSVFEGEWNGGENHGIGRMAYADGSVYKGQWKGGKKHGSGKMVYTDMSVYKGEWRDDFCHGSGRYVYPPGSSCVVYEGQWLSGRKHGPGSMTYASGDMYEGEWRADRRHGEGKYVYADGRVFKGSWVDDRKHGKGHYTYPDGNQFWGEWGESGRSPLGRMVFSDGRVYRGEWLDGEIHGTGEMTYPDGSVYEGEWEQGHRSGSGRMVFADQSIYEGEWKAGDFHGYGTLTYSRLGIHKGYWEAGRKHGSGVMIYASGDVYTGEWRNGKKFGSGNWEYAAASVSPDSPTPPSSNDISRPPSPPLVPSASKQVRHGHWRALSRIVSQNKNGGARQLRHSQSLAPEQQTKESKLDNRDFVKRATSLPVYVSPEAVFGNGHSSPMDNGEEVTSCEQRSPFLPHGRVGDKNSGTESELHDEDNLQNHDTVGARSAARMASSESSSTSDDRQVTHRKSLSSDSHISNQHCDSPDVYGRKPSGGSRSPESTDSGSTVALSTAEERWREKMERQSILKNAPPTENGSASSTHAKSRVDYGSSYGDHPGHNKMLITASSLPSTPDGHKGGSSRRYHGEDDFRERKIDSSVDEEHPSPVSTDSDSTHATEDHRRRSRRKVGDSASNSDLLRQRWSSYEVSKSLPCSPAVDRHQPRTIKSRRSDSYVSGRNRPYLVKRKDSNEYFRKSSGVTSSPASTDSDSTHTEGYRRASFTKNSEYSRSSQHRHHTPHNNGISALSSSRSDTVTNGITVGRSGNPAYLDELKAVIAVSTVPGTPGGAHVTREIERQVSNLTLGRGKNMSSPAKDTFADISTLPPNASPIGPVYSPGNSGAVRKVPIPINPDSPIREWLELILRKKSRDAVDIACSYFVDKEELSTLQDAMDATSLVGLDVIQKSLRKAGLTMGCVVLVCNDLKARVKA
eukprot:CAMPEP_0185032496 /NCGR_PEP_ID=MMETSP1103-20130426/20622_1 /TAXON_ID=36769 /ORGANISM="Paraphysomonas bandaiensis, Strain Caron Lab Isolate" /LENGTH=1099 /DNA_ID=CAMNT_0027568421 /DNA_START=119 /DNA_END=3418 /DNA_ORIENTATION=+